tara:strand:- start:19 stop:1194 length:1176 start_codon:yes stop_codon:yes gene_type:complete
MNRVYKVTAQTFEIDLDFKIFANKDNSYNYKIKWEEKFNLNNGFDDLHFQNNVDLLYRFPNLSLSRDKLSIYSEKSNFKVTRNRELADIVVVSNKYLEKFLEKNWCYSYNKSQMINYCNDVINDSNIKVTSTMLDFKKNVSDAPEDSLFISSSHYWNSASTSDDHKYVLDFVSKLNSSCSREYVSYFHDFQSFQWLIDNQHKIIMDNEVNKLCTGDSIKLSKEDFERMEQLVSSSDTDNVSVGLTLMSNCNVESSKTFVSLLFAFYSEHMKKSKVWNQVNFKYLRKEFAKYVDLSPSNWGHAYNMLIQRLVEDNCLTLYASRYVANKMFIGVLQNNFGVGTGDCVFTIDAESLVLKPSIVEKLINEPENELSKLVGTGCHNETSHGDDLPF